MDLGICGKCGHDIEGVPLVEWENGIIVVRCKDCAKKWEYVVYSTAHLNCSKCSSRLNNKDPHYYLSDKRYSIPLVFCINCAAVLKHIIRGVLAHDKIVALHKNEKFKEVALCSRCHSYIFTKKNRYYLFCNEGKYYFCSRCKYIISKEIKDLII